MKLFKHISLVGALCFLAVSCSDYVDYDPIEDYTIVADVYFQSEADYQAAVVGIYDPLQWMYMQVLIGDIASDNSLSGGESATDVIGVQEIDNMTHNPVNDNILQIWNFLYEGVNRANYLVENKDKLEFAGKEALYGEVHFLRAYYYFDLVRMFGDVPLFVDRRLDATDSGTFQRSPAAEVYAQVESDLQAAIAALPNTQAEKGRATKYAAYALLGKVYLYQEKFPEAANALENVIGQYSLVDDYVSQFLRSGENGPESVFEVQFSNESNWYDWGFVPQGSEGNFGVQHNGPRAYSGPAYASRWSFNVPTQKLWDSYEEGDSRREGTILDIVAWAEETDATYAEGYKHTGYFNHKYIPRAGESGAQTELNYLTNYRAIRYADVLLMAAEANNRGGLNDAKALDYVNQVRERAFGNSDHNLNLSGTNLTAAIYDERNFELAMEGHRFFDLVRTGQAAANIDGFVTGKHELFPIPQEEIDIAEITQNPGY